MIRDKFIFYSNWLNASKSLSPEERLKYFDRILNYCAFGIDDPSEGLVETMFELIKPTIDINNERYLNGQLGGDFGVLGGRPKKPIGDGDNKPKDKKILVKFMDNVFMTQEEYDKLVYDYGKKNVLDQIEDLDSYIVNGKGNKYKDHYKVLCVRLKKKGLPKQTHTEQPMKQTGEDTFFTDILNKIGSN